MAGCFGRSVAYAFAGSNPALSTKIAGWSSQVARRAHNPEAVGSNPTPATKFKRADVAQG